MSEQTADVAPVVQHHFVVVGIEDADGSFEFWFDSDAATFWEGTMYDPEREAWIGNPYREDVESGERDARIEQELAKRLQIGSQS